MSEHNSQRLTSYRAVIPFYILYDLDLNANHLRLYGQIEQMESNPNPSVIPSFSYSWIATQFGINKRNAMKTAKVLIAKGYIEHIEIEPGKYAWNTKKKAVLIKDAQENAQGGVSLGDTGGVSLGDTGGVSLGDTQRSQKIKILKDNNKTPISPYGESECFKKFWNAYPLKKSKAVCLTKWRKKNLDKIADEIISKLYAQIANDRAWINGFIPYPLTYINQERWDDELDMRSQVTTPAKQSSDDFHKTMTKNNLKNKGYYDEHGNFVECFL